MPRRLTRFPSARAAVITDGGFVPQRRRCRKNSPGHFEVTESLKTVFEDRRLIRSAASALQIDMH